MWVRKKTRKCADAREEGRVKRGIFQEGGEGKRTEMDEIEIGRAHV